jgi:hypothetical protein
MLLLFIFIILTIIHTTYSFILHPPLVSSSLLRSAREEPPWGADTAEPRIELRPALQ